MPASNRLLTLLSDIKRTAWYKVTYQDQIRVSEISHGSLTDVSESSQAVIMYSKRAILLNRSINLKIWAI